MPFYLVPHVLHSELNALFTVCGRQTPPTHAEAKPDDVPPRLQTTLGNRSCGAGLSFLLLPFCLSNEISNLKRFYGRFKAHLLPFPESHLFPHQWPERSYASATMFSSQPLLVLISTSSWKTIKILRTTSVSPCQICRILPVVGVGFSFH